jgi:hypothetical protein
MPFTKDSRYGAAVNFAILLQQTGSRYGAYQPKNYYTPHQPPM